MRLSSGLALLAVVVILVVQFDQQVCAPSEHFFSRALWKQWKNAFSMRFKNLNVDNFRQQIFLKNFDFIRRHNARYRQGLETYSVKLNRFSYMTPREFATKYLRLLKPPSILQRLPTSSNNLLPSPAIPDSIDWREKGCVTPVKNQKNCGSCWAFSATGAIEGAYQLKTGMLVSLSEQQLVDCSRNEGNEGCNGGLMNLAFTYANRYGLETEEAYIYKAKDMKCKFDANKVAVNVTGYFIVPLRDEEALKRAVGGVGPVSVGIDAGDPGFMFYNHGIFTSTTCSANNLNHGVLAVGYGTEKGKSYWLVKNSWGMDWGLDGYIKLARDNENMCGIASMASYPTV